MISMFKRSFPALAALCLLASGCIVASASTAKTSATTPTCTGGSSLNGSYGVMVSGGRYLTGVLDFNGACGFTGTNLTGGLNNQAATTFATASGTYGQNSDGTFDMTLTLAGQATSQTYLINVGASGLKVSGIESDNSAVAILDMESQLGNSANVYSSASLAGTYAASCFGSQRAELNYVTFDGKGNLSGVDDYDISALVGSSPYAGTYKVNSDGTFTGALTGTYNQYTFAGVIDNGLTEIEYAYASSGNEVESCSGRQSSTANLTGYYGMVVGGNATNGQGGGRYLSGAVYFSGAGSLTATNLNGGINLVYGNYTATGSYVVNSDNTITITMNLSGQSKAQTYVVAVSEGGNEAVGIETDGTAEAIVDFQAQLVNNSTSYSTASLNQTYAGFCNGEETDVNWVTFDGKGNQVGVDPYNNGTFGDNPYTGTYTVNPDGTFTGNFGGAYTAYTQTGVIDNATSEIEYTYLDSGSGGVVYCIGYSTYGPVGTATVAATPTLNPPAGAYSTPQTVTLSSTTPGTKIYYTTNGVTPTASSLLYNGAITVNPGTTIEALAVASGYNDSAIGYGTYFSGSFSAPTAATPTFNPLPGTYSTSQNVTISDSTPNAVIHYTTNGSPVTISSPVYSSPISVSATTTIQALAVATGYNNSLVATGTYTISPALTWTEILSNANARYIAAGSDGTAGISNSTDQIDEYASGLWTVIRKGGGYRVAVVSQSSVYLMSGGGLLYSWNGATWSPVAGINKINNIGAAADGTVAITNTARQVSEYTAGNWTQIAGLAAVEIAVANQKSIYATDKNKNVWQWNGSTWTSLSFAATSIAAASDGTVIATTSSNQIYQYVAPNWIQLPGTMKAVAAVKANLYYGIGTDNNVYVY